MPKSPSPLRSSDSDNRSRQSSEKKNKRRGISHSPQPDISSHMDHSESSGRRRVHRSSSSSSASSTTGRRTGGSGSGGGAPRAEGLVVTAPPHQQPGPEGAKIHTGHHGGAQILNGGGFGGVSGERRQGRFKQECIRLPDQPHPNVRQVRHRLPTPEPDTIERVFVQRQAAEIVEEITEIPMTPPPIIKERNVVEPAGPPQVVKRVIRVPPRSGGFSGHAQGQGAGVQYSDNLLSAGSYGGQQVTGSYQPTGGATYAGGYGGAATTTVAPSFSNIGSGFSSGGTGFGSFGGSFGGMGVGHQPQAPLTFSVGGSGSFSQPMPGVGVQPAFCFYI